MKKICKVCGSPFDENEKLTLGEKISDRVTMFGGSWTFLFFFFLTLLLWVAVNTVLILKHPFDPYPFIFLNLILSCISAIQAPIILMSQNRQDKKDRLRAENDYKINMKSELEIKILNEKIDHLLSVQLAKIIETQNLQTEKLNKLEEK